MNKNTAFRLLLVVSIAAIIWSGCQSNPAATPSSNQDQNIPGIPYSKGPTSPPSVKGPTSKPSEAVSQEPQAVSESETIQDTLPKKPTVEVKQ